jgi:uncharacterized membrane protein
MKNKLEDVRNHRVLAMEALNQEGVDAAGTKAAVDRAKAMSNVANSYIESVKVEIEAFQVAQDCGMLPASVAQPQIQEPAIKRLGMGRPA